MVVCDCSFRYMDIDTCHLHGNPKEPTHSIPYIYCSCEICYRDFHLNMYLKVYISNVDMVLSLYCVNAFEFII